MQEYRKLPEGEKQIFWQNHVTAWHKSTLSQKDYCKTNNLKLSTFGYWLNRLKKQKSSETGLVPISFTPLNIADSTGPALELVISDSLNLIVPADCLRKQDNNLKMKTYLESSIIIVYSMR